VIPVRGGSEETIVPSEDKEQGDIRDQQKRLLILVVLYAAAAVV
jgi:hypothetical protein